MLTFLLAPENFLFVTAIVIMLLIALIEGVGAFIGVGFSSLLDEVFPEIDFDLELPSFEEMTPLERLLSWFPVKKVPVLVLGILFLLIFGVTGLTVQDLYLGSYGTLLPAGAASLATLAISIPLTGLMTSLLAQILPRDETAAVSLSSLVGQQATITLGQAKRGSAARAKARDQHGNTHYFMIEPEDAGHVLLQGEQIELVRFNGSLFYGRRSSSNRNTNQKLKGE